MAIPGLAFGDVGVLRYRKIDVWWVVVTVDEVKCFCHHAAGVECERSGHRVVNALVLNALHR